MSTKKTGEAAMLRRVEVAARPVLAAATHSSLSGEEGDRAICEAIAAAVRSAVYAAVPGTQRRAVMRDTLDVATVAAARQLCRRAAALRKLPRTP